MNIAKGQLLGGRDEQQDSYDFFDIDNQTIAIMADGMGGHAGGKQASHLVVRMVKESLLTADLSDPALAMLGATNQANFAINTATTHNRKLQGMGTTLICVLADEQGFLHLSVGDSPLFLYRKGQIKRINENHAYVEKLKTQLANQEITQQEFARSPMKNVITSALMGNNIALIDNPKDHIKWQSGDYLILASDGLETLTEVEIAKICRNSNDAKSCVEQLLNAVEAKAKPRQDNCSVVVLLV